MITTEKCHFCGSTDFTYITDAGDKFTEEKVYLCNTCALVFLSPRMEHVNEYYLSDSFSEDFRGGAEPDENKTEMLEAIAQYRWNSVKPYVKEGGTLLEIGCSSGEFLRNASEYMDVYGLDPSTGYAEHGKDLNIKVATFPEFSFQDEVDKFDAICVFHVLEHIPNPTAFLLKLKERLADDGIFVLEYPDLTYAMQRAFLDVDYFQKSHLYDFSVVSLIPQLAKSGFTVEHFSRYKDFPRDKNALVMIRKCQPRTDEDLYSKETTNRVRNALLAKVRNVNFLTEERMFKLCHIASHGINVGDGAITAGIRRFMQEVPLNLEITNFDILDFNRQTQHLVAEEINKLNPDLIIVGGGGTIDGHKSRIHTGTAFQMTMPEIEKLNAPLAFWGLGHNLFRGQKQYNMDMFEDFVLYCKSKEFPFSVRRDKSKERLSKVLSADALDYIQEVPDPGFFVPADGAPYCLSPDTTRNNTILQVALDSSKHRFGKDESVLDNFVLSMLDIILYLIDQHNSDVIIALHTIMDAQATNILRAYYDDHAARNKARMHTRILGTAHPIFANLFFANYLNADMVIGMRGHSVICGTGLGVPTIALSTHDKITGYMDEIGCSEWALELGFDYDELVAKVDGIMNVEDAVRQRTIVMEATEDWAIESKDFAYQCFNRAV